MGLYHTQPRVTEVACVSSIHLAAFPLYTTDMLLKVLHPLGYDLDAEMSQKCQA